jgi:AcrR family transcriptional regulator
VTPAARARRVDADAVVAAAAEIADAEGLEAVTLAAVAARLGIRSPSLYNHVDGLPGLQRMLTLRAVGELGAAIRDAAVGRSGEEAVRAVATAFRDHARAHPGLYAATVRAPAPDGSDAAPLAEAAVQVLVQVVAAWGIEGDEAIHQVRVLRSALHGFVSLEQGGGFGLPLDLDRSFELLVDSQLAALAARGQTGRE